MKKKEGDESKLRFEWVGGVGLQRDPLFFFYSTHLNLPYNHSTIILTVTNLKKITIFNTNPCHHITIGVTDIKISSKSKIKKIIQKTKNRKETGNTLTLKESKPHSKASILSGFVINKILPKPITLGTIILINTYITITHINTLINKYIQIKIIIRHLQNVNIKQQTQNYNVLNNQQIEVLIE